MITGRRNENWTKVKVALLFSKELTMIHLQPDFQRRCSDGIYEPSYGDYLEANVSVYDLSWVYNSFLS